MAVISRSFYYLFIPALMTIVFIVASQYFIDIWRDWMPVVRKLPFYLLPISAILALQFNCSRLSFLATLLLVYIVYEQGLILEHLQPRDLAEPIFLSGTLLITFLAISKDRALLSVHTAKTLASIILCFIIGFTWTMLITKASLLTDNQQLASISLLTPIYVPVGIASAVTCIYAIWRASGIDSTIAVTLFIWLFNYYQPGELPLALLISMLAVTYLFAILTQSYHLAYRDDLTGLSSRRALNTMALSLNSHYSVAMVDIDHFKKFNDTYGHDVGDQVLRLVAGKLSLVKGGGKVYRYGGEEFTIVFPNKDAESILPLLENLRSEVSHYNIVLRHEQRKTSSKSNRKDSAANKSKTVNVTISIGVAEHHGESTFDQTIKLADKALYIAKKNGRNRVHA
ncbi:GGDEF domain-containing protein [Shewanella sp. KX20019]|uniref:GGDEF domain-containing protein n=1 Tax=Shewanella sp. KX20019 TaxID=2803864 RepID=UPI00192784E0|nr:GGDEF domain-containing protein [Shewanella sp. KX20019]QQX80597.1 GGDEF domain-containing protein [Shewanella sp. KX20019]